MGDSCAIVFGIKIEVVLSEKGPLMAKLIFLGTSNAIPDENHENTHMVVVGKQRIVLIDCVNSAILRLQKVGVDYKI